MNSQEIIAAIIAVTVNMGGFTFSQDKRDRRNDEREKLAGGLHEHRGNPCAPTTAPASLETH